MRLLSWLDRTDAAILGILRPSASNFRRTSILNRGVSSFEMS